MKYIFALLLILSTPPAFSCLNLYYVRLDGKLDYLDIEEGGIGAPRSRLFGLSDSALYFKFKEAERQYKKTNDPRDYSDYGVMLIYRFNYDIAKNIFLEIEAKNPGLYATAANLGTAYELLGMNDSALYWIKKAVSIDSNSHNGSEWIHIKILEAKINAHGDDNYYKTHDVLSLDFGKNEIPSYHFHIDTQTLERQLHYQLSERITFITTRDPIMGQLLFDLANVALLNDHVLAANEEFDVAKEYGYESEIMDKRISFIKPLVRKANFANFKDGLIKDYPGLLLFILAAAIICLPTYLFYHLKKRRKNTLKNQTSKFN